MPESLPGQFVVLAALFAIAVLYSSVGHGGASGYIAVLMLLGAAPAPTAASALVLNLLVAGTAWLSFSRAGQFSLGLIWPFLVGSIPAAFLGGRLSLPEPALRTLIALALICASVSLALRRGAADEIPDRRPAVWLALPIGVGLGLLAGLVGVGGGIFLSPLMILCRWGSPKRVAAVSACFILLNSMAGLGGRLLRADMEFLPLLPLTVAAFAGGLLGGWLGSRRLGPLWLRRLLAAVLVVAAFKLLPQAWLGS